MSNPYSRMFDDPARIEVAEHAAEVRDGMAIKYSDHIPRADHTGDDGLTIRERRRRRREKKENDE